ncbi:hypothetical protein KXD93_27470 [Mucilaginibacter sp. BJC16-A38]|uniref:hypothetical protein n=1 Tax=Mucilaginibacter phenanthrenivorans TaxID=1234842 RepID=UPI002157243B|nr:hypothetical protein [Mucilaginibacter phenanthrenivorans]MCR8561424.1 hypothetical protein [Mucilaginibacter phenanthrenivorans]
MINLFPKIKYLHGLILLLIVLSGFLSVQAQNGNIVLADEKLQIVPTEFYVSKVVDERQDRGAVAHLMPSLTTIGTTAKTYPVDLQGGALTAISWFIDHSLPKNKGLRPVIIALKKVDIMETEFPGNKVEGRVSLAFSFDIDRGEDEPLALAEYKGGVVYTRDATRAANVEPFLRQALEGGLLYLNNWMNAQVNTNIKLAHGIKITFSDYNEKPEGDSIYYSVSRPLTWSDFQSIVPNSKYEAEVFPTLGYDERTEVVKGVINLRLAIKVCLPKSAAWAKTGSRNDYTLNHEQRHFDISRIAAGHFKRMLNEITLSTANYDGPINVAYLDAYREMSNLQKLYDTETRHGTDIIMQRKWNARIDRELKELGVKKAAD